MDTNLSFSPVYSMVQQTTDLLLSIVAITAGRKQSIVVVIFILLDEWLMSQTVISQNNSLAYVWIDTVMHPSILLPIVGS